MSNVINKIKDILSAGVKANHFPGASFSIIYKNGDILSDFVGYKQTYPNQIALKDHLIYDVASLTKVVVTTILIMQLVEQNKISLKTNVHTILKRFKHEKITVEDLLIHSSGLPADIPRASTLKNANEVLDYIYQVDLTYLTGTRVIYSDIGFILLGKIVETLHHTSLDVIAQTKIFEPLTMSQTNFKPKPSDCAPTELRKDDVFNGLLQGQVHDEKAFALNGIAGHAGLFSTVNDLSKFILGILNDQFVLNKDTISLLFKPIIKSVDKQNNEVIRTYGFDKPTKGSSAGQYCDFDLTILHTGFTGCNLWIDKKNGIGFVMLSNAVHPYRTNQGIISYRHKIANTIYIEGGFI